ncbi:hypothetical protein GCM10009530_01540 [Microbispora corallina]|uniref:DUF1772 domain-containing protein n=1 Tax=Microbispora corallina TaxID=83302 RepID=A0ABQ4FS31_9ACTN|nr:hypothetical protein Mco01_06180 [Microbispora corallina]
MIVPELTPPLHGTPGGRSACSVLLAVGVIVTGLALAVTALLPWAGVTAEVSVLDAELTRAVRGVDAGSGWFVMGAGIAAMLLGVLGAVRNWLFTGFAILPGAVAAFALAMFLTDPQDLAGRLAFRIPGVVSVHPSIQYGWFAGLLSSIAVAVLAAAAFLRRR